MRISDWSSDVCSSDLICLDQPCPSHLVSAADALDAGRQVDEAQVDARIDAVVTQDVGLILYTSGTTANPKGELIRHRAQVGNSRKLGIRYEVTGADKVWSPLPLFHIAGILPMVMLLDKELGRAACRERFGPYVLCAVVAVSLKKKPT